MLTLTVSGTESWDERKEEFVSVDDQTIQLEHSLVSLSKWESKWNKPFLSNTKKTDEETIDYIKCMTITPDVDPNIYNLLTDDDIIKVDEYIRAPMTATTFSDDKKPQKPSREIITSEIIYYWLTALQVPFVDECQHWHLNRLITFIKVCNIKNAPRKKRSQREIMSQNAALNAARKKQLNTRG